MKENEWNNTEAVGHAVEHADCCREWEKRRKEQEEICCKELKENEQKCREMQEEQFNEEKLEKKIEDQLKSLIDEK
jgi:nicotinamide riboside kinase